MALSNILSARQQILTSQGIPLGGGSVFLFEPGTTTFITSYHDSGLVTAHVNPVRLSGSGRANIWVSRDCDMRIEDRNGNLILNELAINPAALGVNEAGGLIPNGSFEVDEDQDDVPDGWSLASESGSTNEIDTSESTDGAQCFRFTSAGANGGGTLTTTDFFPVNDVDDLRISGDLRSTVAGLHIIIRIAWYDVSQVFISNSDPYDSTSNPSSFTNQSLIVTPPANARFAKLQIRGIDPDIGGAGSAFFDRFEVFYPASVAGVFDNITIQNNEIITTNTDGDLTLNPDGVGHVQIEGSIAAATPATTEAVDGRLDFYDAGLTDLLAFVGHDGSNTLHLTNLMRDGSIDLIAKDASGTDHFIFTGAPGASAISYYNGIARIVTRAGGRMALRSDGDTDTEQRGLLLTHQDGTTRGAFGYTDADSSLIVENHINSGHALLRARQAGGSFVTGVTFDPDAILTLRGITEFVLRMGTANETAITATLDGAVGLRFNDVEVARTLAGGWDVVGDLTLSGLVDTRNVASDGSKLDGIEPGSTADQTSIVGITGTRAQFDTAVTDGNLSYTDHTHQTFDRGSSVLSGGTVFSNIVVTNGIVSAIATRTLSAANVSAVATTGNETIAGTKTFSTEPRFTSQGVFMHHLSELSGLITIADGGPSGGQNGDIWFEY